MPLEGMTRCEDHHVVCGESKTYMMDEADVETAAMQVVGAACVEKLTAATAELRRREERREAAHRSDAIL